MKRPLRGMRAPGSFNPRSWRAGKHGPAITPGRFSGPLRRLNVATAISRRCSTTIAACPCVATRCGRCCTTSIVRPQTGRHLRRGFSGGHFPISLRVCCRRSTSCPCPGNAVRPSREVIEVTKCPGLDRYPSEERLVNRSSDESIINGSATYSSTHRQAEHGLLEMEIFGACLQGK